MQRSTAKKVFIFTATGTIVACFVCFFGNHGILGVFLAVVGYLVMYAVARSIKPVPWYERPRAARRRFLKKHQDRETFDSNEMLVGSSAWVIANGLTDAFQTSDHTSFTDSLNNFDHGAAFASISATDLSGSGYSVDIVHGGTDCTGMHGMGGHNDQGWGTDSHSSMSDCWSSHDSFSSSSSHDPFA